MDAISILVGGAVGFFVSVGKDWLLENKKQKEKDKQLKRERLEELFILIEQWSNILGGNGIFLISVMENKIDYNIYLDKVIENKFDAGRMSMLQEIYATELSTEKSLILKYRDELDDIKREFEKIYRDGKSVDKSYIQKYKKSQLMFAHSIEHYKKELVKMVSG